MYLFTKIITGNTGKGFRVTSLIYQMQMSEYVKKKIDLVIENTRSTTEIEQTSGQFLAA